MSEENKTLIYTELQSGTVGGYVTDYSQIKNAPTQDVIPITTQELYEMQMSNGLIPNKSYLIYDHVTYINNQNVPTGINRTSNLIPFDIIVTASSKNTLYEDAIIKPHYYNYLSPFSNYCNMIGFSQRYNYDQYSIKGKLVKSDFPVMYLFGNNQIFQYFKEQTVTIDGRNVQTNIYVDYFLDHANVQYICIVNDVIYHSLDLSRWQKYPFGEAGFKDHYYDITYMKDDRGNQYTYDAINKLIVENDVIRATFYDYITNGTNVAQFDNQYTKNNNIDKDVAIYAYHVNYDNNVIKNNFISIGNIEAKQLNIDECFEGIFRMETREYVNLYNISIHGYSYQTYDLFIPLVSNKQYYLNPETNTLTENNSNNIIEVTYDQLLEMIQNYRLTPEAEYLITDYVTTLEENVFETGHLSDVPFSVKNDYIKMDILVKAKDLGSLYSEGKALPLKYKSNFGTNTINEPLDILYDTYNTNYDNIYGIVLNNKKAFYFSTDIEGYITQEAEFIKGKFVSGKVPVGTDISYIDSEGITQIGIITDILTPKGTILWMKDIRGNEAPYDFISNSFYIDGLPMLRPGYYYTFTGPDGSNHCESSLYQNIKIKQDFIPLREHQYIIPSIFTNDYGPQHNINVGYYSYVIALGNLNNVNIYPNTYVLVEDCILHNVDILPSNDGTIAHVQEDYTNVLLQASPDGLIVQDKINIKKEQPIIELLSTSSVIEIDNPANFLVGDRVTFKVKQSHRVDKVGDTSRGQYIFRVTQEANNVNNGIIAYPGQQLSFYIEIPMANPTLGLTTGTIFDTIVEIREGVLYFVAIGTEFSSYSTASTSTNGLMSSSDKTKLNTYPATYTEVTSYTDTAIANLVDSAPETLNTLNELAVAIQENEGVVEAFNQGIVSKQDKLISGTNIKTVNGQSLLGNGDLEIQGLKTYTFEYEGNYVEKTITQEELNEILESDKIYIKHDTTIVEIIVKKEYDYYIHLIGYYNELNYIREYRVYIDKINLKYNVMLDYATLVTESDLEGFSIPINYNDVICPNIEDGLVLEEQYLNVGDVTKTSILIIYTEDYSKVFYLYLNAMNFNFNSSSTTAIFYGKYTDTSLLKATYSEENQTLTFNIIEQNVSTQKTTQTIQLNQGWNWVSFYVETSLEKLQNALGTNGIEIKYMDFTTSYDEESGLWLSAGNPLTSIEPSKMYMINTNSDCVIELEGKLLEDVEITLNQGENNISYPLNQEVDINIALQNLNATQGDNIKGYGTTSIATYYNGKWVGPLETLKPGQGYQYTSNSAETIMFKYPDSIDVKLSNYYTKEEIDNTIGDINTILESIING